MDRKFVTYVLAVLHRVFYTIARRTWPKQVIFSCPIGRTLSVGRRQVLLAAGLRSPLYSVIR